MTSRSSAVNPIDGASADAREQVVRLLAGLDRVVVELGCGPNKRPGRIGIDRIPLSGVDVIADLETGLGCFPDHSVDEIHSESFLEHIDNFEGLMREAVRVLKPGGRKYLFVPHHSNPFFYSDYTHRRFFGYYTFYYFCDHQERLRRKVPTFYSPVRIRILSQRFRFYSSFRFFRFLKKILEKGVNSSTALQEFYEENLCFLVPCYGLEVVLEVDSSTAPNGPRGELSDA